MVLDALRLVGSASNLDKAPSNLWRLGWTRDMRVVISSVQRGQRARAFWQKPIVSNDARTVRWQIGRSSISTNLDSRLDRLDRLDRHSKIKDILRPTLQSDAGQVGQHRCFRLVVTVAVTAAPRSLSKLKSPFAAANHSAIIQLSLTTHRQMAHKKRSYVLHLRAKIERLKGSTG